MDKRTMYWHSGTSKYPFCTEHAPPEQVALQAAAKFKWDASQAAMPGKGLPPFGKPLFQQTGTMVAPMRK